MALASKVLTPMLIAYALFCNGLVICNGHQLSTNILLKITNILTKITNQYIAFHVPGNEIQ